MAKRVSKKVAAQLSHDTAMNTIVEETIAGGAGNDVIQITAEEADAMLDAAPAENVDLRTVVKDVKKRKPSTAPRDETGKVARKGRNLSGNQPFARKYYYYDLDVKKKEGYDVAFQALPGQVRLLLKYMESQGISTPDDAMIGADICGGAINSGFLQSKIDPAALFAYYRRVMETVGLRLSMSEGADGEVETTDEDDAGE